MELTITLDALAWFKQEMNIKPEDSIRFFVRYGGCGGIQQGFSLGMAFDHPQEPSIELKIDGVTFYIEESDMWYFDKDQLIVDFDSENEDLLFRYQ